nr:MAG TPA: hypothetical protein [Caudoviricetes sp.]
MMTPFNELYDAYDELVVKIAGAPILVKENDWPVRPLEYAAILYPGIVVRIDEHTWLFSGTEDNLLDNFWTNEAGERLSLMSFLMEITHSGTHCSVVRFPWQ